MRLVTIRLDGATSAGRIEDRQVVLLREPDVKAVLEAPDGLEQARRADGPIVALDEIDLAPVIPRPDKTVGVGKNYAAHAAELGGDRPAAPMYFTKYARSLVGPYDEIELPHPSVSAKVDWEGELGVVIGRPVRDADPDEALAAIAGFTVCNDVSMRDWQGRTSQFLAGKAWERSTPLGPALVTTDEVGDGLGLELRTEVDGVLKQRASTGDMVFTPAELVRDLSRILTLDPGDVIATGTPSGVGHAQDPPQYLVDGAVVSVTIERVGRIENRCSMRST